MSLFFYICYKYHLFRCSTFTFPQKPLKIRFFSMHKLRIVLEQQFELAFCEILYKLALNKCMGGLDFQEFLYCPFFRVFQIVTFSLILKMMNSLQLFQLVLLTFVPRQALHCIRTPFLKYERLQLSCISTFLELQNKDCNSCTFRTFPVVISLVVLLLYLFPQQIS